MVLAAQCLGISVGEELRLKAGPTPAREFQTASLLRELSVN